MNADFLFRSTKMADHVLAWKDLFFLLHQSTSGLVKKRLFFNHKGLIMWKIYSMKFWRTTYVFTKRGVVRIRLLCNLFHELFLGSNDLFCMFYPVVKILLHFFITISRLSSEQHLKPLVRIPTWGIWVNFLIFFFFPGYMFIIVTHSTLDLHQTPFESCSGVW